MNNPSNQENAGVFMDLGCILSDLHRQDRKTENEAPNNNSIPYPLNENGDRKRHMNPIIQEKAKKKRFCWDDMLHYRFLEFILRYGLENISSSKVHEVFQSLSVDIPFQFIDSYVKELRSNIPKVLDDFSRSYNQAMRYQNRITVEGTISRFSVYPFSPPIVDPKNESDTSVINDMTSHQQSQPQSSSSNQYNVKQTQFQSSPGDFAPESSLQSKQSISFPHVDDSMAYMLSSTFEGVDQTMDSQIQLQQDMLYQNEYMMNRNRNEDSLLQADHFNLDIPLIQPTDYQSSLFPISSFLSTPNDSYLQTVDCELGNLPNSLVNQDDSQTNGDFSNIFDFLNE